MAVNDGDTNMTADLRKRRLTCRDAEG